MAYPQHFLQERSQLSLVYPIVFLWGLTVVVLVSLLGSDAGFGDSLSKYYLLPWCFATGAVIAAPSLYLIYKGQFNPFHPLVFPAWSYFFPGFFVGGLALASGLSQPYFLSFVQDEHYNLPLTFIYIMLGYAGLTVGFAIPYAKRLGLKVSGWLPIWNLNTDQIAIPGIALLVLGLGTTILAFVQGILGFQKVQEIGTFDGIFFLLSLFWLEATFLLWLYIFRSKTHGIGQFLIIGLLFATSLTKSAFQGNRGSLIQIFIVIAFAYVFSGRKLTLKHHAAGAVIVVFALIAGMIYGSTFREVKQNQDQIGMGEYAGMVGGAIEKLGEQDIGSTLANSVGAISERLDSVSSLAVVVSNYEALAPYEELWGINDNIYIETVTFLVPRVIWPDKPVAIEPAKYADLYFNYSENSFTMTPMGDLLRNFGPIGVPIGMIFLGFLIRFVYSSLIEDQEFSYWRTTLFYMLLTAISYEGVFGLIVPYMFKVGFTAIVGIILVFVIARAFAQRAGTHLTTQ